MDSGESHFPTITYADAVKRPIDTSVKLPNVMNKSVVKKTPRLLDPQTIVWNAVRYFIHDVPGDGSCYFHCLSLALYGSFNHSRELRRLICGHIVERWEEYQAEVRLYHDTNVTCQSYLHKMVEGNGWATSCEIKVTTQVLGLDILVLLNYNGRLNSQLTRCSAREQTRRCDRITLLLQNSHFQVLTKEPVLMPLVKEARSIENRPKMVLSNQPINLENLVIHEHEKQGYVAAQHEPMPNLLHKRPEASCSTPAKKPKIAMKNVTNLKNQLVSNVSAVYAVKESDNEELHQNVEHNTEVNDASSTMYNEEHDQTPKKELPAKRKHYSEYEIHNMCRKLGLAYESPDIGESMREQNARRRKLIRRIQVKEKMINANVSDLPEPPPITPNNHYNRALDAIRSFEIKQMSYTIRFCKVCGEFCLDGDKCIKDICSKCQRDKNIIKMFSADNNMHPGKVPDELQDLTMAEQQLICKISPCINVHMLKHGGTGSSGHCVTFPQNIHEPATIFPRLPSEINIIKVRKRGRNDTSKEFGVRRLKIKNALLWLKANNTAYSDITISSARLQLLPEDGEIDSIQTVEYSYNSHTNDKGPAPDQINPGDVDEENTNSGLLLNDVPVNIRQEVENIVAEAVGPNHGPVTMNRRGNLTIPWPTRDKTPLSEYTTRNFFTLAFPSLFPYGTGDFHMNRSRTCESLADWAQHLLWYGDGRFAQHSYFKFVVHNILMRKRAQENCNYIVRQQLGEDQISVESLKQQLQSGDNSIVKKILYFSATLRGSQQYWFQRSKELRALIQYKVHSGDGLPSYFTTGSCAEFHWKPLKCILQDYLFQTSGKQVNLDDKATLFKAIQQNSHIVGKYFDLRTKSYFEEVMGPVFGVNCYWYRQEFAKSRGMVHWHGIAWRQDKEPHKLMNECLTSGLSKDQCAEALSKWANSELGMSACHPGGKDSTGKPRKDLWPPPEGSAPPPPEEKNPLAKYLMDVSSTQESLLEDYLLLTNRVSIHRCSDYCLRTVRNSNVRSCRMEFGPENKPGKNLRIRPELSKDKNGSLRLELERDHPTLVQNSQYHTQGWRANGDISVILSQSSVENPSVDDILAVEKYVTGYACKGNEGTGAVIDLFHNIVNVADNSLVGGSSLVSKLLMSTVKRDVSSVEVAYELSSLPLYRSTESFVNVSLTGSRLYEKNGKTICKTSIVDKYIERHENDTCSLYEFVCRGSKIPVITGTTKASWPLPEDYCRCMLILHCPNWHQLSDIKGERSWIDCFQEFCESDNCPNFVKAEILRASDKTSSSEDVGDSTSSDEHDDDPEWMDIVRPNPDYDCPDDNFSYDDGGPDFNWSVMSHEYPIEQATSFLDRIDSIPENENLDLPSADITTLNKDQKFAYDLIMKCLQNFTTSSPSYKPLRLIVGGTAGSGKSYLIKCLIKSVRTLFRTNNAIQVLCPTGNSANIISGKTLHSFLKVPVSHKTGEMKVPDGERGAILQANCEQLKVLLVDERSLIGATTLGWMEFMCRYGCENGGKSQEPWGGLPVVAFFGDDVQLPPVLESAVYDIRKVSVPAAKHGVLVWKDFKEAVILRSIVRQQGNEEKSFIEVLNAVREYKTTREHANWLQQFQWHDLREKKGNDLIERMSKDGLFVFPTRREEGIHNKTKLLDLNTYVPIAKIVAKCDGPHAKIISDEKAAGLSQVVYLCKGAKVTLTVNLNVRFGLYNRSPGIIQDILYFNGKCPKIDLPDVVMVEFSHYSGPAFVTSNPKVVPIVPVQRRIECYCKSCKRTQIPLRLGWGTTIHSCQGQTIGEGEVNRYIIISPGNKNFEARNPGGLFVALSRAKSCGGSNRDPDFSWHPSIVVNEDRLCYTPTSTKLQARSKEIQRIKDISQQTLKQYEALVSDHSLKQFIDNLSRIQQ